MYILPEIPLSKTIEYVTGAYEHLQHLTVTEMTVLLNEFGWTTAKTRTGWRSHRMIKPVHIVSVNGIPWTIAGASIRTSLRGIGLPMTVYNRTVLRLALYKMGGA
jgi:hypothetical protein